MGDSWPSSLPAWSREKWCLMSPPPDCLKQLQCFTAFLRQEALQGEWLHRKSTKGGLCTREGREKCPCARLSL